MLLITAIIILITTHNTLTVLFECMDLFQKQNLIIWGLIILRRDIPDLFPLCQHFAYCFVFQIFSDKIDEKLRL